MLHARYREARSAALQGINAAKAALNRARCEARPEDEVRALAGLVASAEAPAAAYLREHDAVHEAAVREFLAADADEAQLCYELVCDSIERGTASATGEVDDRLREALALAELCHERDLDLLGRPIDRRTVGGRGGRGTRTVEVGLRETLAPRLAGDRDLEASLIRRGRVLAAARTFDLARGARAASIPFEPGRGVPAERHRQQVVPAGLAQLYVPDWGTRLLLPLELEHALREAEGRTLYVAPGCGSATSHALSSVTVAMDVCREAKRWLLVPFLVDPPHHAFGSYAESLREKQALLGWLSEHLRDLRTLSGRAPAWVGRSTGGLLGIELAAHRPEAVACVVALSPPSASIIWQDHVARFFNTGELDAPDLRGYAWFNGGAALAQLDAAQGTSELDELRGVPSMRLQLDALRWPSQRNASIPAVLVLYGEDDTAQYPDDPADFPAPALPDLPLNAIWRAAEREHDHITAVGFPGGHFQFSVDQPTLRRLARELVRRFLREPDAVRRERGCPTPFLAELESQLAPLERARALRNALWSEGFAGDDLLDEGEDRLEAQGDEQALSWWLTEEARAYARTAPGKLF